MAEEKKMDKEEKVRGPEEIKGKVGETPEMSDKNETEADPPKEATKSEPAEKPTNGYGKKNWGMMILIYVVCAIVAYGLIYYFISSKSDTTTESSSTSLY